MFAPTIVLSAPLEAGAGSILYYEPFNATPTAAGSTLQKANTGTVRGLRFNAYGRRFDLSLEKNSRLAAAAAATGALDAVQGPTLGLYRGSIDNIPGSWVRLSAKGQAIRGMIWDGQDLYIVELADAVRDSVVSPLQAQAGTSIIFKLADTLVEKAAAFCGAPASASAPTGSDAYQSLLKELKGSAAIMQALGATVRLELSVLGDAQFGARYPSEQQARDEILLRLNNVDGIFSSQLGVEIQVPTLVIATAETEPLSDTTVPATLLRELGLLRKQTPELRARGITHLFTGREMDGNTVGIAYQDTLCRQEFGAGLTEASGRGSWIESLIAAHEIGHNFGATHDGEAECASTPQGQFLMSPSVSSNASTFSQCSLDAMRPRMQSASCIVALPPADLSIPADLGTVRQAVSAQFGWDLAITNSGGSTAVDSRVELLVPPAVLVDDAWVAGGTCTSGAGVIACQMGDIPGSAARVIHLILHSDAVGTNSISARVSAQNDAQAANDAGNGTLVIEAEADLAVTLQSASDIESGSTATATFSVANLSAIDAATVNVEFALSDGLAAVSAEFAGGNCFAQSQAVRCTLPSLAAGAMAGGTVVINAVAAGAATVEARVTSSNIDPDAANDVVMKAITVTQPTVNSMQSSGSGGGGGGSTGFGLLLGLAGLLCMRRLRKFA